MEYPSTTAWPAKIRPAGGIATAAIAAAAATATVRPAWYPRRPEVRKASERRSTRAPNIRMPMGSSAATSPAGTFISFPLRERRRLRAGRGRTRRILLPHALLGGGEPGQEAIDRGLGGIEERLGHEAHHADEEEQRRQHDPLADGEIAQALVLRVA